MFSSPARKNKKKGKWAGKAPENLFLKMSHGQIEKKKEKGVGKFREDDTITYCKRTWDILDIKLTSERI